MKPTMILRAPHKVTPEEAFNVGAQIRSIGFTPVILGDGWDATVVPRPKRAPVSRKSFRAARIRNRKHV